VILQYHSVRDIIISQTLHTARRTNYTVIRQVDRV